MDVRILKQHEILPALHLIWEVFEEDVEPAYTPEGVAHFQEFIKYDNISDMYQKGEITFFGAFEGTKLCGTMAVKSVGHISGSSSQVCPHGYAGDGGRAAGKWHTLCSYGDASDTGTRAAGERKIEGACDHRDRGVHRDGTGSDHRRSGHWQEGKAYAPGAEHIYAAI